ncbi:phosphatidylcholine and lysophosphatidylcholine phospholipase [Coemansia erecta]|uniref:Lysophospholipase NTE1 n=1 Tax=Coemansia erecta TaxID=147472 RepID=A0A9W8CQC8_9FUNG|nr:phosphatidylcholine and lysophosphatidylcholine phospholipase [Coemansia erecta]
MARSRFTPPSLRMTCWGIGALLVCALALAATAISTTYSTQPSTHNTDVQQIELTLPSDRNIFLRLAYSLAMSLGMLLVLSTVVVSFLMTEIVLPLARHLGYFLLHATRSAWTICILVVLGCVAGLYYFRYYYTAPKRTATGAKDGLKRMDRPDSGFDLHPDVIHSEDFDGTNYMASLEARGNSIKQARFPGLGTPYSSDRGSDSGNGGNSSMAGVGFPADFLSMFMKSISIFGYIEEPVFREFSRQLQTRRLLAGECMFDSDGDRDDQSFYVVIDGQVQVYLVDEDAKAGPAQPDQAAEGTQNRATNSAADAAAAVPGTGSALGSISNGGWGSELYDGLGVQYSSGGDSAASPCLNVDDVGGDGAEDAYYSDDENMLSMEQEQEQQSKAILLNVVGPGDVLSSLFSILSLFTEDVPLKSAPFADIDRPKQMSLPSNIRGLHDAGLADFSLNDSAHLHHHGVYQQTRATGSAAMASESQESLFGSSIPPDSPSHDHVGFSSRPLSKQHSRPQAPTGVSQPKALRPNVIARATTDTTLAMIPGNAFQRVTRLYPKAAAHILQVILTRLQRVTFATLYDYLNLPHELVSVERALTELARCPLPATISQCSVLHQISRTYAHSDGKPLASVPPQSPMFETRRSSILSSRTSPAVRAAVEGTGSSVLQAGWKINYQNMLALARQQQVVQQQTSLTLVPMSASESAGEAAGGVSRHRRSGSDVDLAASVPSSDDIDALRMRVLQQLCTSLGVNPYTVDGRNTPVPTAAAATSVSAVSGEKTSGSASSTAAVSRRSSTHRRALPRTEHLLPLLQTIAVPDHKRRSENMQALMDIPSLVSELELYHLPDGFMLTEQGKRPQGLYVVLEGKVDIVHRDSVSDFTGATQSRDDDISASQLSEATRRMTSMARDGNGRIESRDPKLRSQHMRTGSSGNSRRAPSAYPRPMDLRLGAGGSEADAVHAHRPYTLRSGDIVGYLPALTDMASLYTARSRGGVIVGFLSRWALDRISERFPIVLMTLARRLTAKLPSAILNIDYALEWVQVKASQMVYRQGETSDAVYVVLSGRLRAFSENDGAVAILAEYGQGQSVGEPNLLLSEPSRFNLHAIRDTELVRIPTAMFRALMQGAPHLTFHLSRTLAVRAAQSLQQTQQLQQGTGQRSVLTSGVRCHNRNLKSVALIPVNSDVPIHAFAEDLERTLRDVAGSIALLDHTAVSRVLGRHAFSRIAGLKIVSWISELEQRCRLLLHVADGGISSQWTRQCIRHSDFILLVGLGDGDPAVGEFERLLLALKTTARKELVLLHETRSCRRGSTREWLRRRPWVHAHHHVQMPAKTMLSAGASQGHHEGTGLGDSFAVPLAFPTLTALGLGRIRRGLARYYRRVVREPRFTPATSQGHRSDLARLARYLCGTSVGVVLSGGGARGIALLGVLQAFEEAGIPVDMVGGTSIGALMSGLYAKTPDSVAIHGPLKAFSRRMSSLWRFLLDVTYPILAYTTGREFNRAIWKVFRETEIEDLWLPFYCMTANITRSRPEVHTSGVLWRVVRASMSLGGFVPPLCDENGDMLVDGGYLDNLPVQVMKTELGADMIFAVDIAGENDTSPVRYGASVSGFWVLLNHLNPFRGYWIPTLSEVQSRLTYASSDRELESAKIAESCVYLRVPPRDVGVLDFGRFDELYRRGYAYGREWTAAWAREGMLARWTKKDVVEGEAGRPVGDAKGVAAYRLTRRNSI